MNVSDNDSDSFVDAEDTFYDSNGRPLNLRFSAVQLSSAARHKLLASLPKEEDTKRIIPEISVTDTSIDNGEQELSGLSDGPDYSLSESGSLSEDDQTAKADVSSRIDKDNASLASGKAIYNTRAYDFDAYSFAYILAVSLLGGDRIRTNYSLFKIV